MHDENDKYPVQCGERNKATLLYLIFKDKQMQNSRQGFLQVLQQQMKLLNTYEYPGKMTSLCKILTVGFEQKWWLDIDTQSQLGILSVTKGYLVHNWSNIQRQWR